jgi:hypothetical protein
LFARYLGYSVILGGKILSDTDGGSAKTTHRYVFKLSGIFRYSFECVANRLDDMFSRASALGGRELLQQNLIAKDAAAMSSDAPDEIGH